jgi:phosphinothricin acetyltransferase
MPTSIPPVQIRCATVDDLPAINDIYNYFVEHSTCTYQEAPETMRDRHAWFAAHGPAHPITVAVEAGDVVGWGSLAPYHKRAAYRHTVENSVYVAHTHHNRGIGRLLLQDLIDRARAIGHHTIIAAIDGEQPLSIALHAKLGFREVGVMRELGFKFGRWLDVHYLQLMV